MQMFLLLGGSFARTSGLAPPAAFYVVNEYRCEHLHYMRAPDFLLSVFLSDLTLGVDVGIVMAE